MKECKKVKDVYHRGGWMPFPFFKKKKKRHGSYFATEFFGYEQEVPTQTRPSRKRLGFGNFSKYKLNTVNFL